MIIEGRELVSRPTQVAARSLVIVSSTILVVWWFAIPLEDLSVLGIKGLPVELFDFVGAVTTVFLIISLVLNWASDWVSYSKWYDTANVTADDMFNVDVRGRSEVLAEVAHGLRNASKQLSEAGVEEKEIRQILKGVEGRFSTASNALSGGRNLREVHRLGQLLLYGWYLFVPATLGVFALVSLFM